MIDCIKRAVAILPDTYTADAKKLFGFAIKYCREHANGPIADLFERELQKLPGAVTA